MIIKGVGGFYTLCTEDGERYTCKARGVFRNRGEVPLPGDRAEFSVDKKRQGFITSLLPRKNVLLRPAVANVDKLLIVVAATEPEADLELVDKLLVYCVKLGVAPVIVINKCDNGSEDAADVIMKQYEVVCRYGGAIVTVSAETGYGIESLKNIIGGDTVCLAGQSAVGKTSLINLLLGLSLETGGLSRKTERGRHTTRHAELLPDSSGGYIVDTPGFSMLESLPLEPEELPNTYYEFNDYKGLCRFTGCMHISEPDCAVKAAVEKGEISSERYLRYKKLANEAIEARRHKYD